LQGFHFILFLSLRKPAHGRIGNIPPFFRHNQACIHGNIAAVQFLHTTENKMAVGKREKVMNYEL
jgi:hypothetical protein